MQPGRAPTDSLGVPPLLLARWVGWVPPVRPSHGVWLVVTRPSAALGAHVCALSVAPWRLFTGVRNWCVLCAASLATCSLFTGVRIVYGTRVLLVALLGSPSRLFFRCCLLDTFLVLVLLLSFFFFFGKAEKRCANTTDIGMGSLSRGAAVLCSSSW